MSRENLVGNLRVSCEKFQFLWTFEGFDRIPCVVDHPISSPTFALNDKSCTLWQLLMAKEMRIKTNSKDVLPADKANGVEKKSGESDKANGVEKKSVESDKANGVEKKSGEVKSKDTNENSVVPKRKPERALGFSMMVFDYDECQSWETVTYHIEIKIGRVTLKTEEKTQNGERYFTTSSFNYIFESDEGGAELFKGNIIDICAIIEHKMLETRPLIPDHMLHSKSFMKNLSELYKNGKYADVILNVRGETIKAHKCILSARGYGFDKELADFESEPVHKADFDNNESINEALLIYAYSGRIPEDYPPAEYDDLLKAAKKYEAKELVKFLEEKMQSSLVAESAP